MPAVTYALFPTEDLSFQLGRGPAAEGGVPFPRGSEPSKKSHIPGVYESAGLFGITPGKAPPRCIKACCCCFLFLRVVLFDVLEEVFIYLKLEKKE